MKAPLSIIIPTLNAEHALARCMASLVPGMINGLMCEVIIVDADSTDDTATAAKEAGCIVMTSPKGRGTQLAAGAEAAKGQWLLFLHADTILDENWVEIVRQHMHSQPWQQEPAAAYFRLRFEDESWKARLVEFGVRLRCTLFGLPYGDQGLLISKQHYEQLGGFEDIPLMEDVTFVRKIGRKRLTCLQATAHTDASRYRKSGYFRRITRNMRCLLLHFWGVSPEKILAIYKRA